MNPGIIVRIIEDCRLGGTAKGKLGIYQGNFPYHMLNECGELECVAWGDWDNPFIILDDGDEIWGMECWWEPYEPEKTMEESEEEVKDFYKIYNTHF